jgi:ATP-binding cassette subfamily F protein 3
MDAVELKLVMDGANAQVGAVLRSATSENRLKQLDRCVLEYLLKMLEGQLAPESYIEDSTIQETLENYFNDFALYDSEAKSAEAAKQVVALMESKGLTQKPPTEVAKLDAPLSIHSAYEASLKRASMLGVSRITVNTNDEWTWESRRDAAKNDRKRRKEEEKKAVMREEYEEFLKQRGIVGGKQVVKFHAKGVRYSTDIRCEGIRIKMGKNLLLDGTDLTLLTGHKYGLIGHNGSGKTTLLRHLAEGELEGVSPFIQILHVEQEITGDHLSPLEVVLNSDVERTNLLREEQQLLKDGNEAAQAKLGEIYEKLEQIDAHSAESRARQLLYGLSFTREMIEGPTKALSGGWRMRVSLARALFVEPEVLLLDEPTNHLDLHAVLWLEDFLKGWKKTLVVVSHSRSFLNAVCTEVIHLDQQKLKYYTGNYDMFETTRTEQLRLQERQYEAQEKDRAHLQAFVDRFRFKASKAKMAQSRLKMLEKMETVAAVTRDPTFQFEFPEPEEAPTPYLQVIDADFGYKAGSTLFTGVNMNVDDQTRIALVGANGSGKSTFVKLCLGLLEPRQGQVIRNQKIRVAHFAQHHLEHLSPQMSSVEFMRSKFPSQEEQSLRAHLGSLGLSGDKALQPIYTLSGGQKSRVALAWITFIRPHLLLLDEPTNHLDIETVEALIQALFTYKGSVVIVSHDEHFITSLCDEIWVCGGGRLQKFDGDFEAYKARCVKEMKR